jgi:hypothetical protein
MRQSISVVPGGPTGCNLLDTVDAREVYILDKASKDRT